MTTNSMLPSLSYASIAVGLFKAATIAATAGEFAAASACLESIDDLSLRSHFNLAIAEWGIRNKSAAWKYVDVPRGVKLKMPGLATERAVFRRDSWRCRWCETPVIYGAALKKMGRELPSSFPSGVRDRDRHGLILATRASLDHVVPRSHGGTNDDENLVTSCWPCQFSRGNDTTDRLGLNDPREREPHARDAWDGCHLFR